VGGGGICGGGGRGGSEEGRGWVGGEQWFWGGEGGKGGREGGRYGGISKTPPLTCPDLTVANVSEDRIPELGVDFWSGTANDVRVLTGDVGKEGVYPSLNSQ